MNKLMNKLKYYYNALKLQIFLEDYIKYTLQNILGLCFVIYIIVKHNSHVLEE